MVAYTFADPGTIGPHVGGYFDTGSIDNSGFVTDPAEPDSAGLYYSAWFRFDAAVSGDLELSTASSSIVAYLSVYSGATLPGLVRVDTGFAQHLVVPVAVGTTYYVRAATLDSAEAGSLMVWSTLTQAPPEPEPGDGEVPFNDAFSYAEQVVISGGVPYESERVHNSLLTLEDGEPGGGADGTGFRSAWWRYTPATSGTATFDTSRGDNIDTMLHVYTGTALTDLTQVATDDDSGQDSRSTITDLPVTGGVTYHIRVSGYLVTTSGAYVLWIDGPDTGAEDIVRYAPPANAFVDAPAPDEWNSPVVAVPPADVLVDAPAPDLITATLTLVAPADGLVQPSKTPVFTVDVATDDRDVTLEVEVGVAADFVGAVAFRAPVPRGLLVNRINVPLDPTQMALENNNTYLWRARAFNAWDTTDWTGPQSFSVSSLDGDGVAAGGWTVDTSVVAHPHLWFSSPSAAKPGEPALVYGAGLHAPLTMTIAGAVADVLSVEQVPAAPEAYTDTRVISASHISPAHTRITFVVPDVPGPGGVLYVDVH